MKNSTNNSNPSNKPNNYLRYSGLAFQMLAAIALAMWGGTELDGWLGWKFPVWTVTLLLAAVVGSLIGLVRSLPKN